MAEGNHETDLSPLHYAEFRAAVRRSGARYLKNEIIRLGPVSLAGLALSRDYYRGGGTFGFSGAKTCTKKTMRMLLGACPRHTVLLAHNPLFFPAYAEWGAALTLSTLIVALPVPSLPAAKALTGSKETIITRTSNAEIALLELFFIAFIPLFI